MSCKDFHGVVKTTEKSGKKLPSERKFTMDLIDKVPSFSRFQYSWSDRMRTPFLKRLTAKAF